MQFDTGYKLQKRKKAVHFSNNQFMNGILIERGLTVIPPSEPEIILSDLPFHSTFQFVKYDASA